MKLNDIATPTAILRELGPLEELYWQYGRATPFHFALAAEIEGKTEVGDWRKGLDLLQRRHPLFSASVEQNGEKILSFVRLPEDARIPLRVVQDAGRRWEDEAAKELSIPFDTPGVPLVRAVLIYGKYRSVLILIADHAIADGISLANAFHDLLQAMADGTIEEFPLPPSFEESAGTPRRSAGSKLRSELINNSSSDQNPLPLRVKGFIPKISSLCLTPEQTTTLVESARKNGTTLHGTLSAALVLAGRTESQLWRKEAVRILSPINLRNIVGLEMQSVLAVGVSVLRVEPGGPFAFWDLARSLKRDLVQSQSPEALAAAGTAVAQLASSGLDVKKAADFMIQHFTSEGMVTNLGRLTFESHVGSLRIKALWGPAVLTGVSEEQVIGAGTINGSLCLLHTSPAPFPSLLERMVQTMLEAAGPSEEKMTVYQE